MSLLLKTSFSQNLGKGLAVYLRECFTPQKLHLQFDAPKTSVGCTFCLEGTITTCMDCECSPRKITKGTSGIWYAPETVINTCIHPGKIKWLDIEIEYSRFLEFLRGNTESICPEFLASLKKPFGSPFHRAGRMDASSHTLIEQMLTSPFTGTLKEVDIESKCLTLLLGEISRRATLSGQKNVHCCTCCPQMDQAQKFLLKDLDNPPTIPDLANHVGMSESSLKRAFRKAFGMSVYAYFQSYRLNQAKKLLSYGQMNVTEVAFSVGYSNHSHFSRAFKRQFGISPKSLLSKPV